MTALFGLGLGVLACQRAEREEAVAAQALPSSQSPPRVKHVRAVGQLGPGKGTLVVSLEPPPNGKLTTGAPLSVEAHGEHLEFPPRIHAKLDPAKLPLRIPIEVADGAKGPAHVRLSYYWCGVADGAACHPERAELVVELDTSGDTAGGEAHLSYRPAES